MAPYRRTELGIPRMTEPLTYALTKAVIVEFCSMILFLFFTIGTIVYQCKLADIAIPQPDGANCLLDSTRVFNIAISFGIAIFVLVYAAASFSGGHLNPAVTIGLLVANKISVLRAVLYILAQLAGATTGVAFVKAIDTAQYDRSGGGANELAPGINRASGWLLETILTAALVYMVLAAVDPVRQQTTAHIPALAPLAIGFTVFVAHQVAIPIDGCSINPARTFGAAAVSGNWAQHWLYWVGPITGAVIAALVYELLLRPDYHIFAKKHDVSPADDVILDSEKAAAPKPAEEP